MNGSMKAAILYGIGKISFENRPVPVPKDNEILVKIKHVGICGSDQHYYEYGKIGKYVVEKPIILGHESSGEVIAIGDKVDNIKIGDFVALEPGRTCGKCEYCKSGKYNLCPDVIFMATPPYDGAFVEYIAYPADMAYKLPVNMSTIEGALIEPLAVGLHAVSQARARVGQSAVILGAGCIGLVTLMALKASGITKIYVSDIIPKRLEKAVDLGAKSVINPQKGNIIEKVMDITNNKGVDMVFETAGSKQTTELTVNLIKSGGKIVLVGMAPEATIPFDFNKLIAKEASIETVFRYRNLYPPAIDAVSSKIIPLNKIVTNVFKFNDIANAMDYSLKNKQNIVKAVVEFD